MVAAAAALRHKPLLLPDPACACCPLQHLSVKDIHNALLASRGLHQALQDERVWHGLCLKSWGASTDPHRWLPARPAAPLPGTPTRVNLPPPQTYR